eukprot:2265736-Prymnesium_polylepis.1
MERIGAFILGPDEDELLGHQRVRLNLDRAAHLSRFDEGFHVPGNGFPAVLAHAFLHGRKIEKGSLTALEECCNFPAAIIAALAGAVAAATLMLSHTRRTSSMMNHGPGWRQCTTGGDVLHVPLTHTPGRGQREDILRRHHSPPRKSYPSPQRGKVYQRRRMVRSRQPSSPQQPTSS